MSDGKDNFKENCEVLILRLHDSVKQCQVRFGGRTELATESDTCVATLCGQFDAVFRHGLRKTLNGKCTSRNVALRGEGGGGRGPIMHVRDVMTSLNVNMSSKFSESDSMFWCFVREFLNRHEQERYLMLKNVATEAGRGRAWLRSCLNEHSLERYIHMFLAESGQLCRFYEDDALMRNVEMSNVLPNMAAGLGSILFAINIDNSELDVARVSSGSIAAPALISSNNISCDEPKPVITCHINEMNFKEKRKKKRVPAQIVSFDDDDIATDRLQEYPAPCNSAPPTCMSSPGDLLNPSFGSSIQTAEVTAERRGHLNEDELPAKQAATTNSDFHCRNSDVNSWASNSDPEGSSSYEDYQSPDGVLNAWDSEPAAHDPRSYEPKPSGPIVETAEAQEAPQNHDPVTLGGFACMEEAAAGEEASASDEESKGSETVGKETSGSVLEQMKGLLAAVNSSPGTAKQPSRKPVYLLDKKRTPDTQTDELRAPLTPVADASVGELFPVTNNEEVQSGNLSSAVNLSPPQEDSISIPSYSEDTDNAAVALALVQKASHNTPTLQQYSSERSPTGGSQGVHLPNNFQRNDNLSTGDLRHALVTIMQKKDDLEDQNRSLRSLLDKEMEMSSGLRIENDELKKRHSEKMERLQNKLQTLARENELLKHQLRKYVGAVQMLKRDGTQAHEALSTLSRETHPGGSEYHNYVDYHLEAVEYEKKLIQVAEMHGELMEFNERLHRLLSQKELTVRRLREELVDLRGPLPDDSLTSDDDISVTSDYDTSSMTAATRTLINVWIPSVFLTGKSSDVHHVYQVYVRIRDDEWNIYRRYAQFYALHKDLKRKDSIVNTFDFPPKKVIGNKDAKFVEERRKRLQHYLRCVVNLIVQNNGDLISTPDKETFTTLLPFFGEFASLANRRRARQRRGRNLFTRASIQPVEQPSCAHYTGL